VNAGGVWLNNVRPGGAQDYKTGGDFEEFGNFNYGATGRAVGLSPETLLRGAGAAQIMVERGYDPGFGTPLGGPPYGDDPRDQYWIQRGIEYYERRWGD